MEIRIPNLGEDTESGTVLSVFVKEGDAVEVDQALIEIESEKAVASIPSTAAGTVTKVHVREGDEVHVGAVIVSVASADLEADAIAPVPPKAVPASAPVGSAKLGEGVPHMTRERPPGPPPAASPSIRRMARNLGIDLDRVRGTGRGGRIVLGDLRDYIDRLQKADQSVSSPTAGQQPVGPSVDFSKWGPVTSSRLTPLRRTIAERMVESWTQIPHVNQFGDADISQLAEHRRKYVSVYRARGARLTLTPLILKAVVTTLERHPLLRSSLDEASGSIVTKEYYHVGIAVDTEHGLIVPVIRDVDQKTVFELALEIGEISEKTRQRKISREEMQGGTFTVSNQGGIGGGHFTPIVNKPQVAILGVGRGREVVQLRKGKPETRMLLPLTVSHDHRVVDGANGVRFLADLIETLEGFPESELELD